MGCVNSKKESTRGEVPPTNTSSERDKLRKSSDTILADPSQVTKGKVEDFYEIRKELGRGTFSVVKEGVHKETKKRYALKFIDKKYVDKEDMQLLVREIEIMKKVNHPNILSLIEIFETPKQLSLVMELVTGGELFFKIVDRGSYSEQDAANIVRQIVEGVKYLHGMGIAHRDLKPENLLCTGDSDMQIKIADFGLSKIFAGGHQLITSCGTPDYAAPEVLTGDQAYDKSIDLWSVGVITYVLLCGYPPFYANSQPALFEKIIKAQYDFPSAEWDFISDTAKDFIRNLLVIDPQARLTVDGCLQHAFLAGNDTESQNQPLNIDRTMADYNARRKKEKLVAQSAEQQQDKGRN